MLLQQKKHYIIIAAIITYIISDLQPFIHLLYDLKYSR